MAARVLVFGATGQVATELARANWGRALAPVFLDRAAADLGRPEALGAIVREHAPDAVVIAAAYTAVDRAEGEAAQADRVNGEAPGAIAAAAAALAAPVIHLSTDYVFDGGKGAPYEETDPTAPLNAYGRSKLLGEIKLRAANPHHLILRTSWLYSAGGRNFLQTMLRLAAAGEPVKVVADQSGCPTSARDLAGAILRLVPLVLDGTARWGTYHLAGSTATTWHGFAETIFEELARRGLRRPDNMPIATRDHPTPARRPADSRLSSARFLHEFGFALPGFETAVADVVGEALATSRAPEGKEF